MSYTGRAHPSMRNMRPMAPPKERLMRALIPAISAGQKLADRKSVV